jgi:ubiquinone biosynthesis protein Coq4
VDFLRRNHITPAALSHAPVAPDERMTYLVLRMRQTHDVWHAVTGYAADVEGELLLQGFYLAQTRTPLALVLTLLGAVRYGWRYPAYFGRLRAAYRAGRRAAALAPVYWERHFAEPVTSVRARLGLASVGLGAID